MHLMLLLFLSKHDADVMKGLTSNEWNWPEFWFKEHEAVKDEIPSHFRIAIGGNMIREEIKGGISVDVPALPGYTAACFKALLTGAESLQEGRF
jgi:hypothetical protein